MLLYKYFIKIFLEIMTTKELFKWKINLAKMSKFNFLKSKKNSEKTNSLDNQINNFQKTRVNLKRKKHKKIDYIAKIKKIFEAKNSSVKINTKQKIEFLDQFSNLINSGIPIINTLKIMLFQTKNKKVEIILKSILENLNAWKKLKQAFLEFPKVFTNFDLSIIEMWETTGEMWASLDIIREREEKAKELKSKIIWALIYPTIIVTLSIAMIITFLLFVIPKIKKMYVEARVKLPELTQAVIDTSDFLQTNIYYILGGLFIFIWFFGFLKNNKKTKIYFDSLVLRIPFFGWLIKRKILVSFSRTLWTLLNSWVLISKSLEITKKSLENDYYEKELDKIISWVGDWKALSDLMWIGLLKQKKESFYFPIELASVIRIWEQTGKTPELLLKVSGKFKKELDAITKNIWTAIEPVVIILVGWIIWTIIMAILMPFFNMVNVVW